jgi:hypothetical protein
MSQPSAYAMSSTLQDFLGGQWASAVISTDPPRVLARLPFYIQIEGLGGENPDMEFAEQLKASKVEIAAHLRAEADRLLA